MQRTSNIDFKGKKIFYLDFSNLQAIEEIISTTNDARKYIQSQPPLSVYSLTNVEGMHFNTAVKEAFSEMAKTNKPFVKAGAVVGVTGMKQILLNGIMKLTGREIKSFNTLEQAKEWLASHT